MAQGEVDVGNQIEHQVEDQVDEQIEDIQTGQEAMIPQPSGHTLRRSLRVAKRANSSARKARRPSLKRAAKKVCIN